jgi:UDP-N-acetyl-D-glucosamine dehydrogenase
VGKTLKIAIIGQGYVGLNLSVCAAESGYTVFGYDFDESKISKLVSGNSFIEGISDDQIAAIVSNDTFKPTTKDTCLSLVDIIIIAVPTPLDSNRKPDLKFLKSAVTTISKVVEKPVLIINESTSFPGTLRNEIAFEITRESGVNHHYASSPERVDPGNKFFNLKNTPRLLSGLTEEATSRAVEFYSRFCEQIIVVDSPEIAEAAKLFENTFRQVNIALVNELAQITHGLGISVKKVIEAASTKPYGFMSFQPGAGVGGHCIPVDPTYLAYAAETGGVTAKFIELANDVNLSMPNYVVDRVKTDFGGNLIGISFKVVGIAYKPNVSDIRESPALQILKILRDLNVDVSWHDPVVKNWNGEISSEIEPGDNLIITTLHDAVNRNDVSKAKYVFDCTGQVEKAKTF